MALSIYLWRTSGLRGPKFTGEFPLADRRRPQASAARNAQIPRDIGPRWPCSFELLLAPDPRVASGERIRFLAATGKATACTFCDFDAYSEY